MTERSTKKKQLKFRKIVKNNNSLLAQTPVWLSPAQCPNQTTTLKIVLETSIVVCLVTVLLHSILQQQGWMIQCYQLVCETLSVPQIVSLGEILMLVCVPPQHKNQLTTLANQSLTILMQRRIEIRTKHQNPKQMFADLLDLQILRQQAVTPKLLTLLFTIRFMQSRYPTARVLLRLFPMHSNPLETIHQKCRSE